ncbi:flagellar basal body rod protein FlgB [Haloimpatiens sp. FM7315]|uniref:flagellar basal body rod protein FlgB n=1 Tax=Haloimpatiens sp. FM7315 TaxID=3298609 RepID=UPI0035A315F7
MRLSNNNSYSLLKNALDASYLQGKTIANNISNVNTKGYKRRYVTFDEALNDAESSIEMKKSSDKHMNFDDNSTGIKVNVDESSSMKEDGNNVDIESEIVSQVSNSLMYDSLISEINSRILMRRSVIKGGR